MPYARKGKTMSQSLTLLRAQEIREEFLSQMPHGEAEVVYQYGHGGYVVVIAGLFDHQRSAAICSEEAWTRFKSWRLTPALEHVGGPRPSRNGQFDPRHEHAAKAAMMRMRQ